MPVTRLKQFLDEHGVRYVTVLHSAAFTAQEIAASAHIPGKELAKTVMVRLDGKLAMAVLPASTQIDLDLLRRVTGAREAELANEREFAKTFPGCELGAMPPFGNLYGIEVYAAESLAEDDEIAFNAGSHTELIRMRFADFERLAKPRIFAFST